MEASSKQVEDQKVATSTEEDFEEKKAVLRKKGFELLDEEERVADLLETMQGTRKDVLQQQKQMRDFLQKLDQTRNKVLDKEGELQKYLEELEETRRNLEGVQNNLLRFVEGITVMLGEEETEGCSVRSGNGGEKRMIEGGDHLRIPKKRKTEVAVEGSETRALKHCTSNDSEETKAGGVCCGDGQPEFVTVNGFYEPDALDVAEIFGD
eukprot:CAMPEP_0181341528 /NCGR_PEP_ID=MMETSP1101-20121128/30467_1 /TAXON_ID=46948 /ORGANISM="Rhodomonas abbreviata, Strain Caron Lab Isolate" /LENGTH=208 /DNA_ID=CAMNT_0023452829 /DNA_START=44 /DNA_END=670 /DNA_ORIENTATION=+